LDYEPPSATPELSELACRLVEAARDQGLPLRAGAGVAIRLHCEGALQRYPVLKRPVHDVDLIGRSRNLKDVTKFMESQGFVKVPTSLNAAFSLREIYVNPKTRTEVDIFLDKLQMNHTIELKDRLELDYPTLTVSDLLLSKLQIVKINLKDVTDLVMLLADHPLGDTDRNEANLPYVAKILSNDWGFHYTVGNNIRVVGDQLARLDGLDTSMIEELAKKCKRIVDAAEAHPKSIGWRVRAKMGTSKRWYREVEREGDSVTMPAGP